MLSLEKVILQIVALLCWVGASGENLDVVEAAEIIGTSSDTTIIRPLVAPDSMSGRTVSMLEGIEKCDSFPCKDAMDSTMTALLLKEFPPGSCNIYELPYSMTTQCPNWKRLWTNTSVLFAGGITTLVILQMLPEDATAWNKEEQKTVSLFDRYAKHLRAGPVWDGDKLIFNAILHPYAGGAYYMSARSQGFNVLGSFLYCTCISTFFWEYGIECFNEVPSIQDLIVTPIGGTILGESFYLLKRHIVNNDYRLFGSPILGNIAAFIIDPVNEVLGLFFGNKCRDRQKLLRKPHHRRRIEYHSSFCTLPGASYSINFGITF